jgi:glucokinase
MTEPDATPGAQPNPPAAAESALASAAPGAIDLGDGRLATQRADDGSDGRDGRDGAGRGDDRPLLVGIDIGGTKIAVLVVDREGRVLAREVAPTAVGPQDHAAEAVVEVVERAVNGAGATVAQVAAIGVGVPGRVEPLSGTVTLAVNLGWSDLRLGDQLERRLGRPCVLENDVRAAALGLHRRRVIGDLDDIAYVAVGTGVSAGVVLGGQLHRGVRGLAGEIGHVIAATPGPLCSCGERGCLETLVSGPAIARDARAAIASGARTLLGSLDDLTAVDVYRAAADGDRVAIAIVEAVGRRLAWAVHLLVMTYDVERVVLGGGVSHAGATFIAPIHRELDRLRRTSALAREQLASGIVELLPEGAEAGAWGAVTIARQALDEEGAVEGGTRRREVGNA